MPWRMAFSTIGCKETRDEAVEGAWVHVELKAEAIGEAHLFDGEVALDDFEFLGQRDFLPRGSLQCRFQNGIKMPEHFRGLLLAPKFHPSGDRVQLLSL